MKQVFQFLTIAFVMAAMLTSCSKDDNETEGQKQTNSYWTRLRVNVGNLCYNLEDEFLEAEVTYNLDFRNKYTGDIVIPETFMLDNRTYTVIGIDYVAFANTKITSVSLPKTIEYIQPSSFQDCADLTTVFSFNPQPITISKTIFAKFANIDYANATLYVPEGSVDLYKAEDGWNIFGTIKSMGYVPEQQDVTAFDDLEYFQEYFVNVDSLGNFVSRSIGMPLPVYDDDTTHIYVGVEDLEEALTYWTDCLPPIDERRPFLSGNYPITYTLTDEKGRSQGTVSFAPSTEPGFVADITTDVPGLRHFKKITFVQNDSWPVNFTEGQYHFGDVRTFTFSYEVSPRIISTLSEDTIITRTMNFVCIREKSRGVKPLYVSITPDEIHAYDSDQCLLVSDYCPGKSKAKMIYRILNQFSFSYAMVLFEQTGEGALKHDEYYWIDDHSSYLYWEYWGAIRLFDGDLDRWEYKFDLASKHALLKIDWLDE